MKWIRGATSGSVFGRAIPARRTIWADNSCGCVHCLWERRLITVVVVGQSLRFVNFIWDFHSPSGYAKSTDSQCAHALTTAGRVGNQRQRFNGSVRPAGDYHGHPAAYAFHARARARNQGSRSLSPPHRAAACHHVLSACPIRPCPTRRLRPVRTFTSSLTELVSSTKTSSSSSVLEGRDAAAAVGTNSSSSSEEESSTSTFRFSSRSLSSSSSGSASNWLRAEY